MKFIVYTPFYDENTGGVIVLYKLAQLLRQLGMKVFLWHEANPFSVSSLKQLERKFRYWRRQHSQRFRYISPYSLPLARKQDVHDAIVVYPEVVAGNPLKARHVVRWLLYKPGFHTGVIDFSSDDLFFYYLKEYDYPDFNRFPDNQLFVADYFLDVYRQTNFGPRHGSCFMVRKGKDRVLNLHPDDAIQVDGLSHRELAEVFNRSEYFLSYDLYTMYSVYACMCGCKSVVLPLEGMSVEDWHFSPESRFGVAYGFEDVPRALATRGNLLCQIRQFEENNFSSVRFFLHRCREFFKISSE